MGGDPKSVTRAMGYEASRFNAVRHGVLSKHAVLPWENESEYEALLQALVDEHKPKGPTEEHLVEELAGAIWRKRRLRIGEKAAHARALERTTRPGEFSDTSRAALVLVTNNFRGNIEAQAVSATDEKNRAARKNLEEDEIKAYQALKILERDTEKAYQQAVEILSEQESELWESIAIVKIMEFYPVDSGTKTYSRTAQSLRQFIRNETLPRYRDRRLELDNRSLVREQSFGEAVNTPALDGLARYEVHLDRKFEKTLSMLIRLQHMRRQIDPE